MGNSTALIVEASDSLGASSSWAPVIKFCHCENNVTCDFNYTTAAAVAGRSFYSASCACPDGYTGDRCETTPCNADPSPCYNRTMCHMHSNGSYFCDPCPSGLVGDGKTCQDKDECVEGPNPCEDTCVNLSPGYRCSCSRSGFQISSTNSSRCEDIDECAAGTHSCKTVKNQTCSNTIGSFNCSCPAGFQFNALSDCEDVDECHATSSNPCGSGICVNIVGSFSCACQLGFVKINNTCISVTDPLTTLPPSSTSTAKTVVASEGQGLLNSGQLAGVIVGTVLATAAVTALVIYLVLHSTPKAPLQVSETTFEDDGRRFRRPPSPSYYF